MGFVTLPISEVLAPGASVFAFEPATTNARLLRAHLKANRVSNAHVIEVLVGRDSKANVEFFEMTEPTGMNSVVAQEKTTAHRQTSRPQITLDDFCARENISPDLIKIDVEGAEFDVLEGAEKVLREVRPDIILSVHPRHLREMGRDLTELLRLADALGYSVTEMDGKPVQHFRLAEYLMLPEEEEHA